MDIDILSSLWPSKNLRPLLPVSAVALAAGLGLILGIGPPAVMVALLALCVGFAAGFVSRRVSAAGALPVELQPDQTSSAGQLPAVVEVLELPTFILDGKTNVLTHNRAARELFPQIGDQVPLAYVSRNPELLTAVQQSAAARTPRTLQMLDRVPFGRRLLVTVSPINTVAAPDGGWSGDDSPLLLVQLKDLTEQDRLAQMRSDFIANASHELRTPLASLKGFIETLRGPARSDPAARERFLGIMEAQASRMARILDDLLSLSRIEMRAHLPPSGQADLSAILRTVVHSIEPLAREANVTLKLDTGSAPSTVPGDSDELEQVFQNLVHNAIKYGREGGKAEISLRRLEPGLGRPVCIAVAVADDGPGIAAEHLPRLTERFYRVDTATSRERGGTGLGLAIVKHILNRHRGELEIASKPGEGSTFTVLLPASPDQR